MKIFIAILIFGCVAARAQDTNSAPAAATVDATAFEAFKVIAQRNIFDPNRSPRVRPTTRTADAPKRAEAFRLVGALAYEKGEYAFFDGTSSEYRKSVKKGESIAGYKVTGVTSKEAVLESDGKSVQLPVGSQMKRTEGEEWKMSADAEPFEGSGTRETREAREVGGSRQRERDPRGDTRESFRTRDSSRFNGDRTNRNFERSTSPTSAPVSSAPVSSGDVSEALKRLMERRAQEK